MKKTFLFLAVLVLCICRAEAQDAEINIRSNKVDGLIDSKLYGQLFEHIYFSANNGLWQEMIYERSFEPEHFPGIAPRDGYFDGWFADDDNVLHSPTRYEQPISLTSIDSDSYEITMDVNWRSYKLARRSWSGGLLDIRVVFKNRADGNPYFFRIHDPHYEAQRFTPAQTEAQIQAKNQADAQARAQIQANVPNFSISTMTEKETQWFGGQTRKVKTLDPIKSYAAKEGQIDESQTWHKLRISCKGKSVKAYWDDKQVLSSSLENVSKNDVVLWVNYTEALYRNIRITSSNGRTVYFEGMPEDVKIPAVAPQWNSFGNAEFSLVKDDAVNMRYSQKIASGNVRSGVAQGPQNIIKGEKYLGSIYAKGDGKGSLSVGFKTGDGRFVATQSLGQPSGEWKKYEFTLDAGNYAGDADFAICVENGTVQVDQATLTSQTGKDLGGFRPDVFNTVKSLHPTCLRWPGGGYVAQYNWKWGIGPQEERERWPHWMWLDYDQNAFGTDEFIRFCREIETEPIIVVSVGFERPADEYERIMQDACDWLAYCNEPATGKWGSVRAANGHPEPYNVKYWEIDNEMWEMGIERYEKCVRDFSTAMRKIDPDIKIIVCGGFPEDEQFLKRSGNYFDYMSLHHYEGAGGYATGPVNLGKQYDRYADMIAACPNPNIKLFISEWNLNSVDWRTGLFAGGFLNMCEKKPVVELGAAALFMRRTDAPDWNNAFINFDYRDVYVAPNYQITKLWYDNYSKYRLAYSGDTADLNITTTMSENGADVIVKIVNPTEKVCKLTINGDWEGIGSAVYQYFAPGSLTVANTMENKNAVALKTKNFTPAANTVVMNVEPLSAGVLTIKKTFKQ